MSTKMCKFLLQIACNRVSVFFVLLLCVSGRIHAQEAPYFVTYSDAMEEPGNLEIDYKGVQAAPKNANSFNSATLEFEYGLKAWWTTEVYLSGQTTHNDLQFLRDTAGKTVFAR